MSVKECVMSAVATAGIEGISARYAAQIQELLYMQAVKRMVAEQEAARAQADAQRNAFIESLRAMDAIEEPVKVEVDPETVKAAVETAEPAKQPEPKEAPPTTVAPAQLFDETV